MGRPPPQLIRFEGDRSRKQLPVDANADRGGLRLVAVAELAANIDEAADRSAGAVKIDTKAQFADPPLELIGGGDLLGRRVDRGSIAVLQLLVDAAESGVPSPSEAIVVLQAEPGERMKARR